jgi:hypothetical protein
LRLHQSVRRLDAGYLSNPGNQFGVNEFDTSFYAQINFDYDIGWSPHVRQHRHP